MNWLPICPKCNRPVNVRISRLEPRVEYGMKGPYVMAKVSCIHEGNKYAMSFWCYEEDATTTKFRDLIFESAKRLGESSESKASFINPRPAPEGEVMPG